MVTPKDPEFVIYRNETGVFPQNLFNNTTSVPIIKSVSCSVSTQTNKYICGFVEISEMFEEFRLNCFYCSEMFPLDNWQNFQKHLKLKHFQREMAFKKAPHLWNDHDYTPVTSPTKITPRKPTTSLNITTNSKSIILPSFNQAPPPPRLTKPPASFTNKTLNISLADQVINLLNETILNPIFLPSEEDNIIVIKNSASNNIETSSYLTKLMETTENANFNSNLNVSTNVKTTPCPQNKRPIYSLKKGLKNIPCKKTSTQGILKDLSKNKYSRRIAKQALKNINIFENIYKTVKKRFPQDIELTKDPCSSSKLKEVSI